MAIHDKEAWGLGHWKSLPGNWDRLNFTKVFPFHNDDPFEMPIVRSCNIVPDFMYPFNEHRPKDEPGIAAVHFYLDDFRFEVIWNRPEATLKRVKEADVVIMPDFSTYWDMPMAMQVWNAYRNHWMAAYWQSEGVNVIPNIFYTGMEGLSDIFCFSGIEPGGVMAISTVSANIRDIPFNLELFRRGLDLAVERLQPDLLLCYGEGLIDEVESRALIRHYPSRWMARRATLRK